MSKKLTLLILLLSGMIMGAGIALYRITHWEGKDATIRNGSWHGQQLNNVGKNPLLTARIAVAALLALRPDETIYLVAKDDADGKPLSGKEDYIITGVPIAARYWSITLYGEDFFLVPNDSNKFNFSIMDMTKGQDSTFSFIISPRPQRGNWLPSGEEGSLFLTLRLYHPDSSLVENIATAALPVIKRIE